MSDLILQKFYSFLVKSIPGCVVKFSQEAKKYETIDTKRNGDHYISACLGTDTLLAYPTIRRDILLDLGFTVTETDKYSKDPLSIPSDKKDIVLKKLRTIFINNYQEGNDYYRTIAGLPPLSTNTEIWLHDFSIYDEFGLEPCPIHEVPQKYLKAMEDYGYIETLKQMHPDAEYLNYLGSRRIDIVTARRAEAFDMLYFPNITDSYSFYKSFIDLYNECRDYFMTVVYNNFFSNKYDQYEGYIGFMILTMTINRMIVSNFKAFIDRDFYDEYTTQIFLNAYNVPYSRRFSLSQMKLIAKNLNILLRVKETDLALLNIMDLIGYSDFTLSRYYLIRSHKMDENNNPIFEYTLDPETREYVLDKESMYEYHFSKVPVTTDNVQEEIRRVSNRVGYEDVTEPDPYWVDDDELRERINNTKFNYIETKYMDVTVVYKMHKILFETVYLTRIILDKEKETKKILVMLAKLSPAELPIFDVMMFLIAMVCKLYKVKPTIMNTPSKVLHIAGFNYNADIDAIREDITSHPDVYNQEILKYIDTVIFTSPKDINDFYVNIRNLETKLTKLMNEAHNIKSYNAYKKLYNTLLYIDYNNQIYKLPNGEVAETYDEYLRYSCPSLYKIYDETEDDDDISTTIGYVTSRLMNIFTDTKYLSYIQVMDTTLLDALIRLLCYFKSLTVEMRGINIVLLFDSKVLNCAHFYNKVRMNDTHLAINTNEFNTIFWEYLSDMNEAITLWSETVSEDEAGRALADLYLKYNAITEDPVNKVSGDITIRDKSEGSSYGYLDNFSMKNVNLKDIIDIVNVEDKYRMLIDWKPDELLQFLIKTTSYISNEHIKDKINLFINTTMGANFNHSDYISIDDPIITSTKSHIDIDTYIENKDKSIITKEVIHKDKAKHRETIRFIYEE